MDINSETFYLYQIAEVNLPKKRMSISNLNAKDYKFVNEKCIDENIHRITKSFKENDIKLEKDIPIIEKGDIILPLKQDFRSTKLSIALVQENSIMLSDNFAIIKAKEKSSSEKILSLFENEFVISQIKPLYTGKDYFNITINEINNIQIPIEFIND